MMVNNNARLITEIKDCKYRLPCGWCDRKNELCIYEQHSTEISMPDSDSTISQPVTIKGLPKWELVNFLDTTVIQKSLDETPEACKNCPNHPSNGGSGICNCTLGLPKITCDIAINSLDRENQ